MQDCKTKAVFTPERLVSALHLSLPKEGRSVHITLRLCLGETVRFKDYHLLERCQIMALGVSSSPGGFCCYSDVCLQPSQSPAAGAGVSGLDEFPDEQGTRGS